MKVFLSSSGSLCGGIGDAELNLVWVLNQWVSVSRAYGAEAGLSSSLADNFPRLFWDKLSQHGSVTVTWC